MLRRSVSARSVIVLLSLLASALPGLDTVTCTATTATITEGGGAAGVVVVTRNGTGSALTVTLTTGGTATSGQDFQPLPGTVTIPAGASSAQVYVYPIDDTVAEPTETVTVTIAANAAYTVGSPATATVSILDDEPATLSVAATTPTANEAGTTAGVWTITRTGNLAAALYVPLVVTGTATSGSDYQALGSLAYLASGSPSTTVTVTPIDDAVAEPDETVILTMQAGSGYVLGSPATATVTIADNEPAVVSVVASDATAAEPGTDTGQFRFDRLGSKTAALTVPYVMSGTATNGTDYQTLSGSIQIPAGAASATLTVTPLNDTVPEVSETAILTIQAGTGYTVGASPTATVTIADDEPVVSISAAGTNVAAEPSTNGLFTLTRTGSLAAALTVTYSVGGTATAGTDYTALSGTATFAANSATVTIPVTVIDDAVAESAERVDVTLVAGSTYGVSPTAGTDTVWIRDNETALSTITVAATDGTMSEPGADTGLWTFTRTAPTTAALTISYGRSGTAVANLDYTPSPTSGFVTFPAGATTVTVSLTPIDDATAEPTRTATATISPSPNYLVGSPSSANITQLDDDQPVVSIAATDASAGEPGTGLGTGQFTVTRAGSLAAALTVTLSTTGTATSGSDYTALPTTVTIPANQASATVTVTPVDDALSESPETVITTVAAGSGYTVGSPASATVSIADDDQPVVSILATDPTATEGTGSTDPAVFTVSRVGSLVSAITIPLAWTGTAGNGVDYTTAPTSITIPAGAASATITLTTIQDALAEGPETATATLGTGAGYALSAQSSATATIIDDEPAVSLTVTTGTITEGGVPGAITLRRTGSLAAALTVNLTAGGTGVPGTDYTVPASATFPINVAAVVVPVTAVDDGVWKAARTAVITIATNAAYSITGSASGTLSILDNDNWSPVVVVKMLVPDQSSTTLTLDGSSTTDPENDPLTWKWEVYGLGVLSTTNQLTYNFQTLAGLTVKLTVSDGKNVVIRNYPVLCPTVPTTYDGSDTSMDGGVLLVTNTTLTLDGTHSFLCGRIINSGVVTHDPTTTTVVNKLDLRIDQQLFVDASSKIDATGKGYPTRYTWSVSGPLMYNVAYGDGTGNGGGSHGGYGARYDSNSVLIEPYDSFQDPQEAGAGGGRAGAGGGVILVTANQLTLNGQLKADADPVPAQCQGAGGTVNVKVSTYGGTGTMSANGTAKDTSCGAGGGGRIAVTYGTGTVNSALLTATGSANTYIGGGCGTVWVKQNSVTTGRLSMVLDPLAGPQQRPTPIWLGNRATTLDDAAEFLVDVVADNGAWFTSDVPSLPWRFSSAQSWGRSTLQFQSVGLPSLATGATSWTTGQVAVAGAMNLSSNSVLTTSGVNAASLSLVGSKILGVPTGTTAPTKLWVQTTGNMSIDSGSLIDVTGLGYPARYTWSAGGPFMYNIAYGDGTGNGGGSHGGYGARYDSNSVLVDPYDAFQDPQEAGAGGGRGGAGGGALFVRANQLTLAGQLKADADPTNLQAQGAGGTVNIKVTTYAGTGGVITANGRSNGASGGGGGGRIAVECSIGSPDPTPWQAFGGYDPGPSIAASCGTIYINRIGDQFSRLTLRNNGYPTAQRLVPIFYGSLTDLLGQGAICPFDFRLDLEPLLTFQVLGDPMVFDADRDGLSCWDEYALGTNPRNWDTNGDGISDGASAVAGYSATNLDQDGDGVSNAMELARGSNPFVADTDGDGVADGTDVFPTDPTRTAWPPPGGGDTTPPVITIDLPTGVVPL